MSSYDQFRVQRATAPTGEVTVARGKGAVASVSREASELAVAVLDDGGNAFDAAFALAFSLAVYHPQAGNLGGGGYLVYREAGGARPRVLSFREEAPARARREAFLLPDGTPDPDRTSFGPTSVCVPGTVKAFFTLHERHGRLRARDLLCEISKRAAAGAPVTQYEADCLNRLGPKLAASPEARRIYVKDGPFARGDVLVNAPLARTLDVLAREGEAAFYRGRIAEQIVRDLEAHGGFVGADDLAAYAVREPEPIAAELRGKRVWTPPPEAGGAMLVEILRILDRDAFWRLAPGSPDFFHYLAQASKMAFIDRLEYLGDVPLDRNATYQGLIGGADAAGLFALVDPAADTPTGVLAGRMRAARAAPGASARGGEPQGGRDTTHFVVVDAEGNAVSCSYTMNLRYGSKWAVEGAGFLLNGSIDSFAFVEGKENYYGVLGSAPNLFAPGKRPASNMAPVMVTGDGGAVEMALGTPGGPTIPTTLATVLCSVVGHGARPEAAVQAGRLHHQGWPDVLYEETGTVAPELVRALAGRGYAVKDKHELICDVQGVFADRGELVAVSDHRREGWAAAQR